MWGLSVESRAVLRILWVPLLPGSVAGVYIQEVWVFHVWCLEEKKGEWCLIQHVAVAMALSCGAVEEDVGQP